MSDNKTIQVIFFPADCAHVKALWLAPQILVLIEG